MINNDQLKLSLSKTIEILYERFGQETILTKKFHVGCFEFKYLENTYYGIINLLKSPIKVCHSNKNHTLVDSKFAVIDDKPEDIFLLRINGGTIKQHSIGNSSHYEITEMKIEYKNIIEKMSPNVNFNDKNFSSDIPNYLYKFDVSDILDQYKIEQSGDKVIITEINSNYGMTRHCIQRSLLKKDVLYTNEYDFTKMRIYSLKDALKNKELKVDLEKKKDDIISIVSSGIEKLNKEQLEDIKKYALNLLNNIQKQ